MDINIYYISNIVKRKYDFHYPINQSTWLNWYFFSNSCPLYFCRYMTEICPIRPSEIRVSGIPCRAKWPTRWPMIAPLVAVDAHLQRNASNRLLQSSSLCSDIQISHKQGLGHSVAFSLSLVRLNYYLPLAMLDQYKLLRALLILPWIPMWELWILSSKLLRFAVWTFPFVD